MLLTLPSIGKGVWQRGKKAELKLRRCDSGFHSAPHGLCELGPVTLLSRPSLHICKKKVLD